MKAAARERDRMIPLLKGIQEIRYDSAMDYTADEILSLLPAGMRIVILAEMEKKHDNIAYENHTVQ